MLPAPIVTLLQLYPSIPDLLSILQRWSDRSADDAEQELKEHLASRIFFLLLSDIETAPNFTAACRRIESRLGLSANTAEQLTEELSIIASRLRTLSSVRASGLSDLPYTVRRKLLDRQAHRCVVCGWHFRNQALHNRQPQHASPTLDHIVPYRIGGDGLSNLRIICGLCNAVKGDRMHIGERGRVWSDNFIFLHNLKVVAFWAMVRDGRCEVGGCAATPEQTRLFVSRRLGKGQFVIDNCITRCELHASADVIDY
ncbi:HNH endonuclease signature motif containing protein [Occallatibacter savannae]|uniref:HNH endonuclease n=1 Tax=Occallatibacter savannae TaxID=1002691 RepID=UPI000D6910F1